MGGSAIDFSGLWCAAKSFVGSYQEARAKSKLAPDQSCCDSGRITGKSDVNVPIVD